MVDVILTKIKEINTRTKTFLNRISKLFFDKNYYIIDRLINDSPEFDFNLKINIYNHRILLCKKIIQFQTYRIYEVFFILLLNTDMLEDISCNDILYQKLNYLLKIVISNTKNEKRLLKLFLNYINDERKIFATESKKLISFYF